MNFDGAELAYEDGPHAARRGCILGPGRATVLRQLRVFGGGSRPAQADEWEQRARSELEKLRTGQRRLATSAENRSYLAAFLFSLVQTSRKDDERYDGVGVRDGR